VASTRPRSKKLSITRFFSCFNNRADDAVGSLDDTAIPYMSPAHKHAATARRSVSNGTDLCHAADLRLNQVEHVSLSGDIFS
jgi:hypothetical protein